jgi:hypothetical protein
LHAKNGRINIKSKRRQMMSKFYGQNKKRIDPRYFMDEKLEEAVVKSDLTESAPSWPKDKTQDAMMGKAKNLAMRAMASASGNEEHSPWEDPANQDQGMEDETQRTLGLFDGALENGTPVVDVLNAVREHLNTPAGKDTLADFEALLRELGVNLGEAPPNMSGRIK